MLREPALSTDSEDGHLRRRSLAALIITFALLMGSAFSTTPQHARAGTYYAENLAFPLSVRSGENVTLVLNQTSQQRYIHEAGEGPNQPIKYLESVNGGEPHEIKSIAGWGVIGTGTHNLTFKSSGRIAIVEILPDPCFRQSDIASPDVPCYSLEISEATGFELYFFTNGWRAVSVGGDVDVYFFDEYLRPLGQSKDRVYENDIDGIVTVVPRAASANITFSIYPVSPPQLNPIFVLAPLFAAVALLIALIVIVVRQKKREGEWGKT